MESLSKQEKMTESYVNLVTNAAVLKILRIQDIKDATKKNRTLRGLRASIRLNHWDCDIVKQCQSVRDELTIRAHNIILGATH